MVDLIRAKDRMIDAQLRRRGITDERVLKAMAEVPRERFVAPGFEEFSYEDSPLAIGEGQTISQPYIVALMLQEAGIEPDDIVLEVGTGSGYAAAVMGRLARHVYTIERRQSLGETARKRLADGYDNVQVRIGDGTGGWPEAGPFNAILVAAGGASIPVPLTEQLDIGGRLIIPVGDQDMQRLIKVTRTSARAFQEEDLGGVIFVPLVSGQNGADTGAGLQGRNEGARSLTDVIAAHAEALPDIDDPAFASLFDRFAEKRVVLLGEATHGTSEFHRARAAITRRLIERHGFSIVAVEADWPDAATVDRHVRQRPLSDEVTAPFRRFPTWMWRNEEFARFIDWMAEHNAGRAAERRTGFYGLDLYNLGASIAAVLAYLDRTDPESAKVARERYGCLTPWQSDPSTYGRAVITARFEGCEHEVVAQCRALLSQNVDKARAGGDDYLDASQSARLIAAAERYYRVMYYGGPAAWNLRDDHMFDTLANLLDAKGPDSKAIVWAHNSHIGDARATDMSILRDEINLGQRCRERFSDETALIGFGTDSGTVAAATDWDGAMEIKEIRPGMEDSYERLFHDAGIERHLLDFGKHPELAKRLSAPMLERFIGVIYRPETERASHYVNSAIARQFDAFVWFDRTTAVSPLEASGVPRDPSDTYPFGL